MADRRIYAGYYERYDGSLIYVVTLAKDADTGEDMVIWTPVSYSETGQYYTMRKASFCEYVAVDGRRRVKFRRQTQLQIPTAIIERCEVDGLRGPVRKQPAHLSDEYDDWRGIRAASYYEYAKKLCEQFSFCVKKYNLCVAEKRYIGISKADFLSLKEDILFLKNCMRTALTDYAGYFEERFVQGLSIRKYAQTHELNRGSVDHLQRKFFTALARLLKERDDAEGKNRLRK